MEINDIVKNYCIDITELLQKMQQVLYANYSEYNIRFTAAYPQVIDSEDIKMPLITYEYRKTPGEMGGRLENGPRLRDTIDVKKYNLPIDADYLDIYAQMFDYWMTFEIYGQNGMIADATADIFENFMIKFEPYFRSLGVSYIKFIERDFRAYNVNKTDAVSRVIKYRIRLESLTHTNVRRIKNIGIEAEAETEVDVKEPIKCKIDASYEQKLNNRLSELLKQLNNE